MNQWSRRRKRIILSIVLLALFILVGAPIFFLVYQAPTCFDGKQNGSETGVDCGGSCQLLCTALSLPLVLKGDPRVLNVLGNTFEVVALAENSNTNGEIYRAGYIFKFYDTSGTIPIKIVEGETYVPKGTIFAIFEGPFNFGDGVVPTRATFEWKEGSLVWEKNTSQTSRPVVRDLNISREDTNPRLEASIENISLRPISNIDLTALIYDDTGSIFAASKTFIDTIPVNGVTPAIFTWPGPFNQKISNIDIIIRVFPDRSFVR